MKKLILCLLALILLVGCTPVIPEPEPQEKNVLMELFVGAACSRCIKAKETIAPLKTQYGDRLIPLLIHAIEYPLDGWKKIEFVNRLHEFSYDCCPCAFFDGAAQVYGYDASNTNYAMTYGNAINTEMGKPTDWIIEGNITTGNDSAIISCDITGDGMVNVGAYIVEDDVDGLDNVVRDILPEQIITDSGNVTFTATKKDLELVWNMDNIRAVVYVEQNDVILQVIEIK